MAAEPDPEHSEWVRRMRELARQDAAELVPRPLFAVLGLSAPVLHPAALAEAGRVNEVWEKITVVYGDPAAPDGPHVTVTTAAPPGDSPPPEAGDDEAARHATQLELLRAIDAERDRLAAHAGIEEEEPALPPRYTREKLPAGEALVCRHGTVWAARLLGAPDSVAADVAAWVTVTITGRGVDPDLVRLGPAGDLRPYFEARNEILGQLTERLKNQPPPVLPPAEGIAAFRALADYTLESGAKIRQAGRARRGPGRAIGDGRVRGALWQRAVREQQRLTGIDRHAADDVVTLVINHLGHLAEQAPWFTDPRLRELAIDETLRHAMLGDDVPSKPAQQAWARYWGARTERWRRSVVSDEVHDVRQDRPAEQAWRNAWAVWARRA